MKFDEIEVLQIEEIIGYTFKNKALLDAALTHPSYGNQHGEASYQRMEFLGDSIVGFALAEHFYKFKKPLDEGCMTVKRSELASDKHQASVSESMGLEKYIRYIGEGERVPRSVLGDVFESVTAAIYLDSKNIKTTKKFVLKYTLKKLKS